MRCDLGQGILVGRAAARRNRRYAGSERDLTGNLITMAKLRDTQGVLPELLTDPLDEEAWWKVVRALTNVLAQAGVARVNIEFGFVVERDAKGLPQGEDGEVALEDLERLLRDGFGEGTIERKGGSDFVIAAVGPSAQVLLCNDADIHFGSRDAALLGLMEEAVRACGLTVHGR
jgi:hypothetical protein